MFQKLKFKNEKKFYSKKVFTKNNSEYFNLMAKR